MNLKQLEAFVRVAETKSFSAAAKQLYLTQPTVSAHIASLEKELGGDGLHFKREGHKKLAAALEKEVRSFL